MRARIRGRRVDGRLHYFAAVIDGEGVLLWSDDCSDLARLADEAREVARAFDCVARMGQVFRPWVDIVDEAGRSL